jgi:hypothetical protein
MKRKYVLQTGTVNHSGDLSAAVDSPFSSKDSCNHLESNAQGTTLPFSVLQLKTQFA